MKRLVWTDSAISSHWTFGQDGSALIHADLARACQRDPLLQARLDLAIAAERDMVVRARAATMGVEDGRPHTEPRSLAHRVRPATS